MKKKTLINKFSNYERHKYETQNLGDYELLFPLVDANGFIVGDHSKDYQMDAKEAKLMEITANQISTVDWSSSWVQETDHNSK